MCPGMLPAKFQGPSIYIDRYFQLCDSLTQALTHSVSKRHTQDVELCTWPE